MGWEYLAPNEKDITYYGVVPFLVGTVFDILSQLID